MTALNRNIQVGVLGVGHIGAVHLQSASAMDGVTVVAAADAVPGNRQRAESLGAPKTYADYEELLVKENLDVALVALPPFLHAEATKRAADQDCNVFVEKPLARSVDEAREMLEYADSVGIQVGVDHTLRYHPEMRRLKEHYDGGGLGHVPFCHLSRANSGPFESPPATEPVPGWQLDPELAGGGALMDLGIHLFDLLEWFFGGVEVRHAELAHELNLDYEDTAAITLQSAKTGTLASVHCGFYQWEEPPDVNLNFRLNGVAGSLESSDFVPNFYVHAGMSALRNVVRRVSGREPTYYGPTYYYQAHFEALAAFIDVVRTGGEPPVGGREGLQALELVEQAYDLASDHEKGVSEQISETSPTELVGDAK